MDIHANVLARNLGGEEYDTVSVIIETKGCWHPESKSTMKTQLAGRYLKDNPCRYGLYLVGWFLCAQWDGSDYRKGQTPKLGLDQARIEFDAQASGLSGSQATVRSAVIDAGLR